MVDFPGSGVRKWDRLSRFLADCNGVAADRISRVAISGLVQGAGVVADAETCQSGGRELTPAWSPRVYRSCVARSTRTSEDDNTRQRIGSRLMRVAENNTARAGPGSDLREMKKPYTHLF